MFIYFAKSNGERFYTIWYFIFKTLNGNIFIWFFI